jgi:hypothetical protein
MASGEQQVPRSPSPLRGCERTRNDKDFFFLPRFVHMHMFPAVEICPE